MFASSLDDVELAVCLASRVLQSSRTRTYRQHDNLDERLGIPTDVAERIKMVANIVYSICSRRGDLVTTQWRPLPVVITTTYYFQCTTCLRLLKVRRPLTEEYRFQSDARWRCKVAIQGGGAWSSSMAMQGGDRGTC